MSRTKESLEGTCIFCATTEKAKKAIDFYISFGFESYTGSLQQQIFVGVRHNTGFIIIRSSTTDFGRVINLPSKPRRKFPREMMVSEDKTNWKNKVVFAKIKGKRPFLVNYLQPDLFKSWTFARELTEKEQKESEKRLQIHNFEL